MTNEPDGPLLVGPLLRYVDEHTASVWVETVQPADVTVRIGRDTWSARTFMVHGHSYALVEIDGLESGSRFEYEVEVDGALAWPVDEVMPPSVIRTLVSGGELTMAFGSCRMSVPHDDEANKQHGVDALRSYARALAADPDADWPDLLLCLGDQVYADETSREMQSFIAARRSLDEPPGTELKDYEEYAHLYRLAWTDPVNRWLLSTLPSAMIFDDHDIRDDWNTSAQWRREIARLPWWHDRIVGGLASYWVYQHLGNLSPEARAADEIWSAIQASDRADSTRDWGDLLDAFAERADEHPDTYRWSFARDFGANRLVVIDSRAARVLKPAVRSMLDDDEMAWFDDQFRGGFDHVIIGTSLPFLLSRGLHYFEAWNEAVASGAWGRRFASFGERLRRAVDLEHWAAFHDGFVEVAKSSLEVARGSRGPAPGTITFLSGDVHHSYIAEVTAPTAGAESRIVQAVCSPIRNPLSRRQAAVVAFISHSLTARLNRALARRAGVERPPIEWDVTHGPWFDNNLAVLRTTGRTLGMRWYAPPDSEHPPEVITDVSLLPRSG